jgi:hypothetical protein
VKTHQLGSISNSDVGSHNHSIFVTFFRLHLQLNRPSRLQYSLHSHAQNLHVQALSELQPILEAWAGMPLIPAIAYGFRLYRNESSLWMHIDRTQTHVISCIYHIDSSDNAQPWPIVIEDYIGNTNQVILKPGDILLYESAKVRVLSCTRREEPGRFGCCDPAQVHTHCAIIDLFLTKPTYNLSFSYLLCRPLQTRQPLKHKRIIYDAELSWPSNEVLW